MADETKGLFPELPEDLKALSDDARGKPSGRARVR